MNSNEETFYCPSCGAQMKNDNGALRCTSCNQTEQACASSSDSEDFDFIAAESATMWDEPIQTTHCTNCGSEAARLSGEAPSVCAYCGGRSLSPVESGYGVSPGWIAPFKLTVPQADERLDAWLKKRFIAPFSFRKQCSVGAFHGVFLPYWSFSTKAQCSYTGQAGNYYRDTEVNATSTGERTETNNRRVRKVRWRMVSGNYNKKFSDVIFGDASHINSKVIKGLEPFKLSELVKYDAKYMPGHSVERYKLGLKGTWERAKAYMSAVLRNDITAIVRRGSDVSGAVNICTQYTDVSYKLMLLPVWVSAYQFKGKSYNIYINGQTGEIHGSSPTSVLKIGIIAFVALAAAALLVWLL